MLQWVASMDSGQAPGALAALNGAGTEAGTGDAAEVAASTEVGMYSERHTCLGEETSTQAHTYRRLVLLMGGTSRKSVTVRMIELQRLFGRIEQ
jgi:hypothetical protein